MASTEEREQQALALCNERISSSRKHANSQRNWWGLFKYTTIVVTVALTVISGLSASTEIKVVDWLIPVMSGVAALAATFLASTRVQEQYLHHRKLQVRLEGEKALFEQSAGVYSKLPTDEARVRRFTERMVEMWTSANEEWEKTMRDTNPAAE